MQEHFRYHQHALKGKSVPLQARGAQYMGQTEGITEANRYTLCGTLQNHCVPT